MKKKLIYISIFILSFISLIISLNLLWNMGIFADEYNVSPKDVCGGDFWLLMYWLRLALTAVICTLSGIGIFRKNSNCK